MTRRLTIEQLESRNLLAISITGLHHEQIKLQNPGNGAVVDLTGGTFLAVEDTHFPSGELPPASWPARGEHPEWESANSELYPVTIRGTSADVVVNGGVILGAMDHLAPWHVWKQYSDGPGIRMEAAGTYEIKNTTIKNVEDGIDPRGTGNFYIHDVYMDRIHDDMVENDAVLNGEIANSFLRGHTFLSAQGVPTVPGAVVHIRNVVVELMLQPHQGGHGPTDINTAGGYPYPDGLGNGSIFKWSTDSGTVDVKDSVFLVNRHSTSSNDSMAFPPGTYSNVTVVWLGNGDYPWPAPAGVTITRDRSVFDQAADAFFESHPQFTRQPPSSDNQSVSTGAGTLRAITLSASDPDGDLVSYRVVDLPSHGTLAGIAPNLTYSPSPNFHGSDSFTFRATDGALDSNLATVTIAVGPGNNAPVSQNDSYSLSEDLTLTVAASGVLANDSDVDDDPLTAVLDTGPSHGTLTLSADGGFVYTPAANYHGFDSFTYRASDATLASNPTTVTITTTPFNDAPIASSNAYSINAGATLTVAAPGVLGNDADVDSSTLSTVLVTGPGHGTLSLASNGSFTYTPAAGFSGVDSFTYRASDGSLTSNIATVTLDVAVPGSTILSFQDGLLPNTSYKGARDTTIKSGAAAKNFGTANPLIVDGNPSEAILIKWDLAAIPAGSTVTAVTLTLNVANATKDAYGIFPLRQNWSETGATWNVYSPGNPWQTAGALGANDRGSQVATIATAAKGIKTLSIGTEAMAAVQGWINNPATNFGFAIQRFVTSADNMTVTSREGSSKAKRPKITIEYAPPPPPSSLFAVSSPSSTLGAAATDQAILSLAPESTTPARASSAQLLKTDPAPLVSTNRATALTSSLGRSVSSNRLATVNARLSAPLWPEPTPSP